MYEIIKEDIGRGVPIVNPSRVPNGHLKPVYGFIGGGKTLKDAGGFWR
jgi:L-asparaginase